jgi:hypothetical protein
MGSCDHRRWHFYRVAIEFFMAAILATPKYCNLARCGQQYDGRQKERELR